MCYFMLLYLVVGIISLIWLKNCVLGFVGDWVRHRLVSDRLEGCSGSSVLDLCWWLGMSYIGIRVVGL
jgi:hypothetical protein